MREHHKLSIEKLISEISKDKNYLAIILSGSIAKGCEKENSDIDVYIVVTDDEFKRRKETYDLFYFRNDICDYSGGYIDGKVIDYEFIKSAAEHGSEPTRASFTGTNVVYSKIPEINDYVNRIPVYQESERDKKLSSFYSQVQIWGSYMFHEGINKDNPYLTERSATELVFYASRYILAYNRILFPGHKSMFDCIKKSSIKPDGFIEKSYVLMQNKTKEAVDDYMNMFNTFADKYKTRTVSYDQAVAIFVEDSEWNWINGNTPLGDS